MDDSRAKAYCACKGLLCLQGGLVGHFTLLCPFSPLSPSLWETTRYRLKYCVKGPLNPKQPTNQKFYPKRLLQPCTDIIALHMHLILKCLLIHKTKKLRQITCSVFTFVQCNITHAPFYWNGSSVLLLACTVVRVLFFSLFTATLDTSKPYRDVIQCDKYHI